jgi:hypothetical protein
MILDLTQFGYGCGIVLVAWVAGQSVACVFSLFRKL